MAEKRGILDPSCKEREIGSTTLFFLKRIPMFYVKIPPHLCLENAQISMMKTLTWKLQNMQELVIVSQITHT